MDRNLVIIIISLGLIVGIIFFDAIYGTYGEVKISSIPSGLTRIFYPSSRIGEEIGVTYKINNHKFSPISVDQPYLTLYYKESGKSYERILFESSKSMEKVTINAWKRQEWKWNFVVNDTGNYRVVIGNRLADEYSQEEPGKETNEFYVGS